MGAADADVVEAAVVAEADEPGFVDAVGSDAVVGVGGAVAGQGFWAGGVGSGGGGAARERPVRAVLVVDGREGVQQCLRVAEGGGLVRLGAEPVRLVGEGLRNDAIARQAGPARRCGSTPGTRSGPVRPRHR